MRIVYKGHSFDFLSKRIRIKVVIPDSEFDYGRFFICFKGISYREALRFEKKYLQHNEKRNVFCEYMYFPGRREGIRKRHVINIGDEPYRIGLIIKCRLVDLIYFKE